MEDINSQLNSSILLIEQLSSTRIYENVNNRSDIVQPNYPVINTYEWRFVLPLYVLIFILSISGNFLVIATLVVNRRMRTITNVYLLNLAVSDFLLGVLCLPFTLIGQMYKRFIFGAFVCKILPFLQAVSVSVDVWTLVAISLERYFAICRPFKSRRWQTQSHANKMIALVWILSCLFNFPIIVVSTLQPLKQKDGFKCREQWPSRVLELSFTLVLDAGLLLIPFFIMSFAYFLTVTKLWRGMKHEIHYNFNCQSQLSQNSSYKNNHLLLTSPVKKSNSAESFYKRWNSKPKKTEKEADQTVKRNNPSMQEIDLEFRHVVRSTHIDKSIEAKRRVIRMMFVLMIEFFVCWTPLHIINTVYLFYPKELFQYIGPKGIMLLQLLAYCSSCSNPITYCFMNKKFKQAFIGLFQNSRCFRVCFRKKTECKQATPPPASSSQEVNACVIRGSQTGRTELDGLQGEDCV